MIGFNLDYSSEVPYFTKLANKLPYVDNVFVKEVLDALTFNIYKVSQKQLIDFESIYNPKDKAKYIKKLKALKSFESTLKSIGDYQEHSTEIVLPMKALIIVKVQQGGLWMCFTT